MVQPIVMPKLGQSEEEAKIVQWRKKVGDRVNKGDILFEIETDKALLEVESFLSGTLLRVVVSDGEVAPVQSTVGYIGEPGEAIPEVPLSERRQQKAEGVISLGKGAKPLPLARISGAARIPLEAQRELEPPSAGPPPSLASAAVPSVFRISPRAARLAKEIGVHPSRIVGTGPGGRVLEKDVAAYLKAKGYDRLRITPAARALAASKNLDLLTLEARGDSNRITLSDVRRAIEELPRPLPRMRQVIAERLTRSFRSAPHFFVTVSVDMTDLVECRAELKAQGRSYTVTDFILKALALTLPEFPLVNSTTDGVNVVRHSKVHLGLAVSLDEGLVVPVIRDAEDLSLDEIHFRATELTEKARGGRLTPADMAGSTFTISNMGMLDVENFTAIINPGEGAILAVSSILKQPAIKDDQVAVRWLMKMTLTSDHRLIDGAMAARFVNAVKQKLEEKTLWKRLA